MINRIHIGHVLDILRTFPDGLVDCVVTSPPYWGLRDYGTEPQIWDGAEGCEHEWGELLPCHHPGQVIQQKDGPNKQGAAAHGQTQPSGQFCIHCSAWRGSLGLEPTPDLYVSHMVQIFREVRRVLKPTGSLWLNLGDSYAAAGGDRHNGSQGINSCVGHTAPESNPDKRNHPREIGLKPKDLVGIPWRVAFALQSDGWYLRSDIIWSKPNPMPESVRDRPTKAHEYIFLLSKSQRYYFDQDAVREESVTGDPRKPYAPGQVDKRGNGHDRGGGNVRSTLAKHRTTPEQAAGHRVLESITRARAEGAEHDRPFGKYRNIRSVWTIATQPYKEAHFATFPEAIPGRCIKAGCPEDGIVLDPFVGSGTVVKVAIRLRRNWIGIDLNPKYGEMAERRVSGTQLEAF